MDLSGAAEVIYDDTSNGLAQPGFTPGNQEALDPSGAPVVTIARQSSGPGLLGKDVSGISQFTVLDADGKEHWKLYGTGTVKPPKIVYGVVPSEPADSWKQLEPGEGALPPDIRGKHIKVEVSTRLDTWFGVAHQQASAEFDVPR